MTALIDWWVARTGAGECTHPRDLPAGLSWVPMRVPGTALAALREAGSWGIGDALDPDVDDWWFRCELPAVGDGRLRLGGLATIAEAWVDGVLVLHSENMFLAHEVDVVTHPGSELVVVCRSLQRHLATRRPRGRWRTRLVEAQQLRWVRTTLFGRMPGWNPRIAPVGPWRPVTLTPATELGFERSALHATLEGDDGVVVVEGRLSGALSGDTVHLVGVVDGVPHEAQCQVDHDAARATVTARLRVAAAPRWFPATHGPSPLVDLALRVDRAGEATVVPLGRVGFRDVQVAVDDGGFAVSCNGVEVFCRGACWTPPDPVSLWADASQLRAVLDAVVSAGMNMLRVTGTLTYEQDEFYDLCDELGIMVFHDLMFANMDYPVGDDAFVASTMDELRQFARRMQGRPCVVVVCGGSEVDQQAAMMGLVVSAETNPWGHEHAAGVIGSMLPAVAYVPSSPTGGTPPFRVDTGIAHYSGVGAYLRSLDDPRRAGVRFSAESLAFSNVPAGSAVDELLSGGERPGHSPRWKERVPRDRGAGWDFEDVRDHYVRELFAVDPTEVRWTDPDRYLDLGRAAVCVAIESTVAELRRPGSRCAGVLVLMLRDVWLGAGWGVIDANGRPKSAFHALARACAPVAVFVTDEGLNGLVAHVVNDRPEPLVASLRVSLFNIAGTCTEHAVAEVRLAGHDARSVVLDEVFVGFRDLAYAYRFGPLANDVVSVELIGADGRELQRACVLPGGHARERLPAVGLVAEVVEHDRELGTATIEVQTQHFAQFVNLEIDGWEPTSDWFHLPPGSVQRVDCRRVAGEGPPSGTVRALNSHAAVGIRRPG